MRTRVKLRGNKESYRTSTNGTGKFAKTMVFLVGKTEQKKQKTKNKKKKKKT